MPSGPSGLAAITIVNLGLLKAGDEVLLPANVYGPSLAQARTLLAGWGITHRTYDPMDAPALAAMIGPATRLVWLEAPGSVTMEFPDLTALVQAARARGVVAALDNTWGAGLAFRAFDLGVDIAMQALTKYPSGGADVLMGSVVTRDLDLHHRLLQAHAALARSHGLFVGPVYTGKAFAGMLAEIAAGRFEGCRDIVFIHTGGIFGLFPQRGGFSW